MNCQDAIYFMQRYVFLLQKTNFTIDNNIIDIVIELNIM